MMSQIMARLVKVMSLPVIAVIGPSNIVARPGTRLQNRKRVRNDEAGE